ncbi:MAG: fumarylacetoacetate hydrolase family protein [Propionibacteriaceae bacterium]|nr:fumarylacetoacetate hydrolase family protein [Propionibacteriaceae bacterium]
MTWSMDSIATEVLACEAERREREPFTDEWEDMTLWEGYAVQDEALRRRLARGEHLTGVKLGLTSKAKQERMNLTRPLLGWLTDAMILPVGTPVSASRFIHPRVEPEIVFVMGRDLVGPGISAATAMAAVEWVVAGVEIIDSRFANFRFRAPDVVSDNSSSAAYVTGGIALRPDQIDLGGEAVSVEIGGQIVDSATGAAILGHPGEALALAANQLAERGLRIHAGQIVLTGGMTDAYPVPAGAQLAFHFAHLGSIHIMGGE